MVVGKLMISEQQVYLGVPVCYIYIFEKKSPFFAKLVIILLSGNKNNRLIYDEIWGNKFHCIAFKVSFCI